MPIKHSLLLILLLGFSLPADALERRYLASLDEASWVLAASSVTQCRLEHVIPRFGSAVFIQEAGRGLRFELDSRHRFKRGVNVELRLETASWNRRQTRALLARFETVGGRSLFRVPSAVAERIFFGLRQGYQPGFLFYTDAPLVALLSAVRFGEAEAEFTRCVGQLHDVNFEDVRVSSILFEPDNEFASLEQEATAFEAMFDYLRVDDAISEIVVTGHADHTGLACYNEGLSERRAWYVYDMLIARGIDADLLRVDYRGEQIPVKRAGSKNSLAASRRVTVELRR